MAIDYFKQYDSPSNNAAEDEEIKRLTPPKPQQPSENIRLSQNRQAVVMPGQTNGAMASGAGIAQGGSAPAGRLDAPKVQPNTPRQNVVMPDAKGNYGAVGAGQVRYDDLPSTQMMRAATGRASDFTGAIQRNSQMWDASARNALAEVQARARAAREAKEKNRRVEEGDAKRNLADAYTLAVDAWRNAEPQYGHNADGTDSKNKYKVGVLEPATIRDLNGKIAPIIGMRKGEKIIGMYAVTPTDANGEAQGMPTIIVSWRAADGTKKRNVISYKDAAQYVRDSMGDRGDQKADWNFVQQYGGKWSSPDGGDVLGLSRTGHVMAQKEALEVAGLKTDLARQRLLNEDSAEERAKAKDAREAAASEVAIRNATNAEARAQAEFEQKQQALAEAKKNKPIADARAEVDRLDKLVAAEKDEAAKQNWISQADAARKVLADRQAEARLADITEATEEGASPDNMPQFVKKDGKLVLKDGWMMKKQANGKSGIVLKPGWILGEDGNPVQKPKKVTAKKQNAPANQQASNPSRPSQQPAVAPPTPITAPTIAEGSNAQRAAIKRAANRIRNWAGRNYIPD